MRSASAAYVNPAPVGLDQGARQFKLRAKPVIRLAVFGSRFHSLCRSATLLMSLFLRRDAASVGCGGEGVRGELFQGRNQQALGDSLHGFIALFGKPSQ